MVLYTRSRVQGHTRKPLFLKLLRASSAWLSQNPNSTVLVFLVVLLVTLATCTLLFQLLLYSQYYKFCFEFCNFVAF